MLGVINVVGGTYNYGDYLCLLMKLVVLEIIRCYLLIYYKLIISLGLLINACSKDWYYY